MVRSNKEKRVAIRAFLNWFEKEILKGSVEEQKHKTKIRNFHEGTEVSRCRISARRFRVGR
jgi:hypothetical protein